MAIKINEITNIENRINKLKNQNWFGKHWIINGIISIFLILIIFGVVSSIFDSANKFDATGNVVNEQTKQTQEIQACVTNWNCNNWGECGASGIQRRICTDLNNCGIETDKPSEVQTCEYITTLQTDSKEETESLSEIWQDFLNEVGNSNEEKDVDEMSVYEKKKLCAELCAGEDIDIPYVKSQCSLSCTQVYYYGGEDSLDNYIKELQAE